MKNIIVKLLTEDSYYRRLNKWPLLKLSESLNMTNEIGHFDIEVLKPPRSRNIHLIMFDNIEELLNIEFNDQFPIAIDLLNKYGKNIAACGGSICRILYTNKVQSVAKHDIDFFFYNLNSVHDANILRENCLLFIIENSKRFIGTLRYENKGTMGETQQTVINIEYYIIRNEYVTTLYVVLEVVVNDDHGTGRFYGKRHTNKYEEEYDYTVQYTYQFIHRIYPSIDTILGGFDIGSCMVALTSSIDQPSKLELYTIPLGAWSIVNTSIIVDMQRRSTSYEYRLSKYHGLGFTLILPGLPYEYFSDKINDQIQINEKKTKLLKMFISLAKEYDFYICDSSVVKDHLDYLSYQKEGLKTLHVGSNASYSKYVAPRRLKYNEFSSQHASKKSDYYDNPLYPFRLKQANATRLRMNNLKAVVSIIHIDNFTKSAEEILFEIRNDAENPDIKVDEIIMELYRQKAFENTHATKIKSSSRSTKFINLFVEKASELLLFERELISSINNNEEIDAFDLSLKYKYYIDLMIERMRNNIEPCIENLRGIKWITQNPGRQWISSINPIITDPREWYSNDYVSVVTGIPKNVEVILRLLFKRKVFGQINRDLLNLILLKLYKISAN